MAKAIPLNAQTTHIELTQSLAYWNDDNGSSSLARVSSLIDNDSFKPLKESFKRNPKKSSVFWYYFQLNPEQSALEKEWLLELDYLLVDKFTVYTRSGSNSGWSNLGELKGDNANDLELIKSDLSFNLSLPFEQLEAKDILIRVDGHTTAAYALNLWEETSWRSQSRLKMVGLSLFYGAFLVMISYNFMLFLGTREKVYLIYTCYVLSILLFSAGNDGSILWVTTVELPTELRMLRASAAASTGILVSFFAMYFLNTRERLPLAHRWLKALSAYMLVTLVTTFVVSLDVGMMMVVVGTPILSVSLLGIGLKILLDGHKEARLFLVGWTVLMLASIYKSIGYSGLVPFDWMLRYCMQIGSAIEIVFLSLALADRINTYKEQKDKAEQAAKKELQKNNEVLEESNRVKNEFIATISHELRTPLNGIIGAIELSSNEQESDQREKYNAIGLSSALKMNSLVNDMLVFSELLTQDPQLKHDLIELKSFIQNTMHPMERFAQGKGLAFHCMLSSNLPDYVEVDKENLGLIISHLVDNAVKFTQEGEIYFKVKFIEEAPDKPSTLEIEVRDSGCGIDPALQNKIFESYRQLDGSFSRSHGGLGIGLALVRKILQISGGDIRVDSNLGSGSTFSVSMPVVAHTEQASSSPSQAEWSVDPNEDISVLVVEDNAVNQKILCKLLDKLGCGTTSALNGSEAVDACKEQTFDLIFMDCQMPVMNGFEATLQIRQLTAPNPNIPIIAVTANATEQDMNHCMQVGMNEFVKKPVNKALIEGVLIKYLKQNELKRLVL